MYRDVAEGSDAKITEKSEKARKEFFQKCEKLKKGATFSDKLITETANAAAMEYTKLFGRIGVKPLLHLKGGKKRPRYLVDRQETWVLYKPPLWQQGGSFETWRTTLMDVQKSSKSLKEAEEKYLNSEKAETFQEWHMLQSGMLWLPPEHAQGDMKGWGFIQRLDLETDGPVYIAKTWRNMRALQTQMKLHVNTKAYMALVHGRLEQKTQHIRRKFAELGSDQATQVMLQHDAENDPFYDWVQSGKWRNRSVRMAETFFTPLAYYRRKEDNSDYTLVYVNILTGITHQIRITMQSCGHPLVSDDRYLPRDQAMADLKWCPRNFLVEVRSDFFDVAGPFEDPVRRKYERISIENPLPQMFQNILTKKLQLTEVLDPTADLFIGPQYWAIGDYELMSAYPKDEEFRKKVMRWGQRRGIHVDALDRLLVLSKDEIEEVLNNYRPPAELGADTYSYWICPACMHWNTPESLERAQQNASNRNERFDPDRCRGGGAITAMGRDCTGRRQTPEDEVDLPKGWLNYASDPTIHLLYMVNPKWLEARRNVMRQARPAWVKPPEEAEGSMATKEHLAALEEALIARAKQGFMGIPELDLRTIPGLEDISLPLALPHGAAVHRERLPGRGTGSQWTYTLKCERRIEYSSVVDVKIKRETGPLYVKTDPLPPRQVVAPVPKEEAKKNGSDAEPTKVAGKLSWNWSLSDGSTDEPPEKKMKATRKWERRESKSNPGKFYFVNTVTGETSVDKPQDLEDAWEAIVSKSSGKTYYFNAATGESQVEKPSGVEIKGSETQVAAKATPSKPPPSKAAEEPKGVRWERRESTSKPGSFYYFNHDTGDNEVTPPRVDPPWSLLESKTKRGQFYYYNDKTAESRVDPPSCARAANKAEKSKTNGSSTPPVGKGDAPSEKREQLPAGWKRCESEKYKGKVYYTNSKTNETSWKKPSPWERCESASHPGKFYYKNCETGETSWTKQVVGVVPD